MTTGDFSGAKIAILWRGRVLTIRRDMRPDIPFPGQWDLPGGGREGTESPVETALRETEEELGLRLPPSAIGWQRAYPGVLEGQTVTWFLAAEPAALDLSRIRLGDEGQGWRAMPVAEFLSHTLAIGHLKTRLAEYLGRGDLS